MQIHGRLPQPVGRGRHPNITTLPVDGADDQHRLAIEQLAIVGLERFERQRLAAAAAAVPEPASAALLSLAGLIVGLAVGRTKRR